MPQYNVFDCNDRIVGRADFGWQDCSTLGEFDGRGKYGRLLKPGETVAGAVSAAGGRGLAGVGAQRVSRSAAFGRVRNIGCSGLAPPSL